MSYEYNMAEQYPEKPYLVASESSVKSDAASDEEKKSIECVASGDDLKSSSSESQSLPTLQQESEEPLKVINSEHNPAKDKQLTKLYSAVTTSRDSEIQILLPHFQSKMSFGESEETKDGESVAVKDQSSTNVVFIGENTTSSQCVLTSSTLEKSDTDSSGMSCLDSEEALLEFFQGTSKDRVKSSEVASSTSIIVIEKVPDSTYEMVGGLDKQIKEIKESIELPMKHPELFDALGITQPKGVLLYGPHGIGKTLVARAVAHHTQSTFLRVSGSELVQKFFGEGSRMVRELFVMARERAPSIIFIDEIDLIAMTRIESGSGSNSEVQRTMLELLNQLDGLEAAVNIKVVMATDKFNMLDPSFLRLGCIDNQIEFPPPNEEASLDILKCLSRKMVTRGINLRKLAEYMPRASGAEIKDVCTEAGLCALQESRVDVRQEDFEMAVAKVMKQG